jgi:hypothetical protein
MVVLSEMGSTRLSSDCIRQGPKQGRIERTTKMPIQEVIIWGFLLSVVCVSRDETRLQHRAVKP